MNKNIVLQSRLVTNWIFSTVILTLELNFLTSNKASGLKDTVKISQERAGELQLWGVLSIADAR